MCSDYVPDAIKQRMYWLYRERGWDVPRLAARYGLRTDRVSVIINMKKQDWIMKKDGRYRTEVDQLMTQMYGGKNKTFRDPEPSTDVGIDVEFMQDDEAPHVHVPKVPATLKGKLLRVPIRMEKVPQPPVSAIHARMTAFIVA